MSRTTYRGKRRRPSTNKKRILAAAATGAGVVIGVLGSSSAAHADGWDSVAQCESGGNWHTDTGNGFYGGLQFTQQTWDGAGGQKYAPRADKASPAQQKAVANRVLHSQGRGAWPVCNKRAGSLGGSTSASGAQGSTSSVPQHTVTHKRLHSITPQHSTSYTPRHAAPTTSSHGSYTVRAGDTLSSIAAKNGVSGGWRALAAHNSGISDPNMIYVGQSISL